MNTTTITGPYTEGRPSPLIGRFKCNDAWGEFFVHGICFEILDPHNLEIHPCSPPSAASPAAACARAGGTVGTTSSGQPTPQTDGNADASAATAPAVDVPEVPEWCEKNPTNQAFSQFVDFDHVVIAAVNYENALLLWQTVCSGLAALRASRDHWREHHHELAQLAADLRVRCDRQIATIDHLRGGIDAALSGFCDPHSCNTDPFARKYRKYWANSSESPNSSTNHPEKPESSWRERCRVVEMPKGRWDIQSEDGLHWWDERLMKWYAYSLQPWAADKGMYKTPSDAYQALSTIPTPPPEEPR